MRVLFCGDRDWTDHAMIEAAVVKLPPNTVIIHGACRGADRIAGKEGRLHSFKVIPFPAEWALYGKAAGPIRNEQMINEGLPAIVYAFHDHLDQSTGTRDMIDKAESVGIPVTLFTHREQR